MHVETKSGREITEIGDAELHDLACRRDELAVRELTRRFNQRLYRVAWSILGDRPDAEEAVQDAYVKALSSPASFRRGASYATWLTRIAINQALDRKRTNSRRGALFAAQGIAALSDYRSQMSDAPISNEEPERAVARAEFAKRLEAAVSQLSDDFRTVFVLRDIEGLGVDETAESLGIPPATVKTRLLRARRRLREILEPELRGALRGAFPFGGARCAAMTERVLARLNHPKPGENE